MYLATAQSIPATTTTYINFDTVDFDPNGNVTTGAGAKYTVPVNGFYIVSVAVALVAAVNAVNVCIYKNGAGISRTGSQFGAGPSYNGAACDIISCVAGDYLQATIYAATGPTNTQAGPQSCWLSAHFLSPS